jgi:ParB-like chromosome segregation protein Spo0J
VNNLTIFYLPIGELTPYSKNTRKHAEKDVRNIKKSIEEYGMNDPIGIWSDKNIIVEGHGRFEACKQLGMTEVPCIS